MSNKNKTDETEIPTTDATPDTDATAAAGTAERAQSGSSVAAQCKFWILKITEEIRDTGGIYADTLELINELASEIRSGQTRGLSPAEKLLKFQTELDAVYASCATVADVQTPEKQEQIGELSAKINSLKKSIAKTAERAGDTENAEAANA